MPSLKYKNKNLLHNGKNIFVTASEKLNFSNPKSKNKTDENNLRHDNSKTDL